MKITRSIILALSIAATALSCQDSPVPEPVEPDPIITASPASFQAPMEGGSYSVSVSANFEPVVVSGVPEWISWENQASGYSFTVAPNEGPERKCTVTFRNETASVKAFVSFTQAADPEYGKEPVITKGISNLQDLLDYAAAVNAGESTEKWEFENGTVHLLDDIDMSEVKEWTPIGNAVAAIATTYSQPTSGKAFSGKFDGGRHTIKNFKVTFNITQNNSHCGFFGTLAPGAEVKNLIFDESCSVTVNADAKCCCGVVAGYAFGAELSNITTRAAFSVKANSRKANSNTDTGLVYSGCVVGALYSGKGSTSLLERCINEGSMAFSNSDGSKVQSYKGYTIGGVVGFMDNGDSSNRIVVTECTNTASISTDATRSGGIIATASNHIDIINCENRGNITNNFNVKWYGMAGGIASVAGTYVSVSGCMNYGNMTCTVYGVPGGIIGNVTGDGCEVSGCYNCGNTLSSCAARALIIGMLSANKSAKVMSTTVDGKSGDITSPASVTNPNWDVYSEANKESSVVYLKDGASCPCTDITYAFSMGSSYVDYENAKLKILFIGNSFTVDAVHQLPKFVDSMKLDKIQLTNMYYAGRPIVDHYSGYEKGQADYTCYQCGPGHSSWTTEKNKMSLKEAVTATDWDIITIQECTGHPGGWSWSEYFPDIKMNESQLVPEFVKLIKRDCPNKSVKLYYIMSQAYGKENKTKLIQNPSYFNSQDEMYACIVGVGRKVMETGYFSGIVATGTIMQNLRASSVKSERDFTRDTYHMDNGISRFCAAACVFETLISPTAYANGLKLDNCKYRIPTGYVTSNDCCTAVTDELYPFCMNVWRAAMEKPFEVTVVNP